MYKLCDSCNLELCICHRHILQKSLLVNKLQGECFPHKMHIPFNGKGRTVSRHSSNALIKSYLAARKLFQCGQLQATPELHSYILKPFKD